MEAEVRSELEYLCSEVKRGVKPAASFFVPTDKLKEAEEWVDGLGLLHCAIRIVRADWPDMTEVYVFAHQYMKEVILNAPEMEGQVYHWYWGKVYGYSEESIAEFMGDDVDGS